MKRIVENWFNILLRVPVEIHMHFESYNNCNSEILYGSFSFIILFILTNNQHKN